MDFVTLDAALTNMAKFITVEYYHQYVEEAFRLSEAARILHQTLKNHPESRPLWVECYGGRRPLYNDDVFEHGFKILKYVEGWYEREGKSKSDHAFRCHQSNLDPNVEPRLSNELTDKYPLELIMRAFNIGFDRAELIAFLDRNEIEHTLKSQTLIETDTTQPNDEGVRADRVDLVVNKITQTNETQLRDDGAGKRRRDKQLRIICETANKIGYQDSLAIPEGGKAAIKAECLKNTALFTDSAFDHAWKAANKRNLIRMQDKEKYL